MAPQTYGAFGGEEGAVREPREAESIRQFKANAARLMRWRANTMKLSWVLPALVLVVYGSGVGQSGLIAQAEPATKLEQATDSKIERVAARASVDAARRRRLEKEGEREAERIRAASLRVATDEAARRHAADRGSPAADAADAARLARVRDRARLAGL